MVCLLVLDVTQRLRSCSWCLMLLCRLVLRNAFLCCTAQSLGRRATALSRAQRFSPPLLQQTVADGEQRGAQEHADEAVCEHAAEHPEQGEDKGQPAAAADEVGLDDIVH